MQGPRSDRIWYGTRYGYVSTCCSVGRRKVWVATKTANRQCDANWLDNETWILIRIYSEESVQTMLRGTQVNGHRNPDASCQSSLLAKYLRTRRLLSWCELNLWHASCHRLVIQKKRKIKWNHETTTLLTHTIFIPLLKVIWVLQQQTKRTTCIKRQKWPL